MNNLLGPWSLAVVSVDGQETMVEEGSCDSYETSSAIKSPIGMLALDKCIVEGIDPHSTRLHVDPSQHGSNGSGRLKNELNESGLDLSIWDLLVRNIIDSDCVATNSLTDFVGGKSEVNSRLADLNIGQISLDVERITFDSDLDDGRYYGVGTASPIVLAKYHRLLSTRARENKLFREYTRLHSRLRVGRLFGLLNADLPDDVTWTHKTGSMFGDSRVVLVDAGALTFRGTTSYVAFMHVAVDDRIGDYSQRELCQPVAEKNVATLEKLGLIEPAYVAPFNTVTINA